MCEPLPRPRKRPKPKCFCGRDCLDKALENSVLDADDQQWFSDKYEDLLLSDGFTVANERAHAWSARIEALTANGLFGPFNEDDESEIEGLLDIPEDYEQEFG